MTGTKTDRKLKDFKNIDFRFSILQPILKKGNFVCKKQANKCEFGYKGRLQEI